MNPVPDPPLGSAEQQGDRNAGKKTAEVSLAEALGPIWDIFSSILATDPMQSAEWRWKFEQSLLTDPRSNLREILRTTLAVALSLGEQSAWVRVHVTRREIAYMAVRRMPFLFPKLYRISVDSGFPALVFEISEYYTAQALHVSKQGEPLPDEPGRGPEFSKSQIETLFKRAIESYVGRDGRWGCNPVILENVRRRIYNEHQSNLNYHERSAVGLGLRTLMLFFTVAHELGHVLKGHCDAPPKNLSMKREYEFEADAFAAELLLHYTVFPPTWWRFAIDQGTSEEFCDAMMDLGLGFLAHYRPPSENDEAPASSFAIHRTFALQAVATIFAIHELSEAAAVAGGKKFEHGYPTARERWEAFRTQCVSTRGIPESMFTEFNGVTGAVDETFERFQYLGRTIRWFEGPP